MVKKPINSFPGYEFVRDESNKWHNMYRGTDVGFGGYVYSEPGIYENVALLDVGNMHGASILALNKLGPYTKNFKEIRDARMCIKSGDLEKAKTMLGGKLAKYLSNEKDANELQLALKLICNESYGISAANFANPLRDPRDKNNIIALRGALFMRTLQDEIQAKGYRVIHIKTDSCKVPNADKKIIDFIVEFGRKYDYEFEHEASYSKLCLINNADYVARDVDGKWTATGARFSHPYVFKTLFSKEKINFKDMCEVKNVTKGDIYIDFNENLNDDSHNYRFVGRVGEFCPIKDGYGGGILYRVNDDKYYAVPGSKGYRWKESEVVRELCLEDEIDISYHEKLCQDAIKEIEKFGSYEEFVS